MAFRRSVISRTMLLYQHQRAALPFLHIHGDDNHHENLPHCSPISSKPETPNYFQRRSFGTGYNLVNYYGSKNLIQDNRFGVPAACRPPVSFRNMSSVGEGSADKIEIMTDMADALGDKAVDVALQAGPVVNEVAVAAADSFFPVAALQYLVDYIHIYTGFDWWASIVLTTILIRTLQLPLTIHQNKATSKFTLLRPRLTEIREEMQSRDMSPAALAEGQARMKELFQEYGVTPFTPLKGFFIIGPVFCCFFLAIINMAEKVQSFKEGGALWFVDLATPDPLYILPVLTALTFWINVECNALEGLEGNPSAGTFKNVARVFAASLIPLTLTFPKAIFFYWITSNLYSLAYGLVIKNPQVKKLLGIPIIAASSDGKSALSFSESLKEYSAGAQHMPSSKPANNQSASSSSLSQKITSLEEEVKRRKKG